MTAGDLVLEMRRISKSYYGIPVLRGVDLELRRGEVLALVGENGAGKSTLMNILFGMPAIAETGGFEGEIRVAGRPVALRTPREALAAGIGMVHQEFMLLPELTVAENVKLNREPLRPGPRALGGALRMVDRAALRAEARRALDHVGLRSLDEAARVGGLPVGYLQLIEIAREVDRRGLEVLVLDEPTAVLAESEATELLKVLRALAREGLAILFITHRLGEVMAFADRVLVLRDGEVVEAKPVAETSVEEIAERMVGRRVELEKRLGRDTGTGPVRRSGSDSGTGTGTGTCTGAGTETGAGLTARDDATEVRAPCTETGTRLAERGDATETATMLEIRDLFVDMPGEALRGLSIEVRRGEVLGLAGLAGGGKVALANGIFGLHPARAAAVRLDGEPLPLGRSGECLRRGLAFVSEDRRGTGLLLDEGIARNISFPAMAARGRFLGLGALGPFALVDRRAEGRRAREWIDELDIRCTGPDQRVRRLSGGNQQKVCIARALELRPRLLFVSEPTRGIDVGAKRTVLERLVRANREDGTTLVVASSELAELRTICDRIGVVAEGRLAGVLRPDAPDVELGLLMAGLAGHGSGAAA